VVNNASVHRLSSNELTAARAELDALFEDDLEIDEPIAVAASESELLDLQARSRALLSSLNDADEINELENLIDRLSISVSHGDREEIEAAQEELADFLYYATNNAPTDS
jgi:molecular chaperone DnaK